MKTFVAASLMCLCGVSFAFGAPLKLKCVTSDGESASDLVLDLKTKEMVWGVVKYRIRTVTDRYISAFQIDENFQVGGETWVLDRITGEYLRASIAILFPGDAKPGSTEGGRLTASTYRGRCVPPIA
jgi:hypothetical protein